MNPIGLHPQWQDFIPVANQTGTGFSVVTEYGVTTNVNLSHDVAQQQHLNASPATPASVPRGLFARVTDAYQLPWMSVWGMNFDQPNFFNAQSQSPFLISSLSSINFQNRYYGHFNCSGISGAPCGTSGDLVAASTDDSALARKIARQISNESREAMPFAQAISGAVNGMFDSIPMVQAMNGLTVDGSRFRPPGEGGIPNVFQSSVIDIARAANVLNSDSPLVPEAVRTGTKLFACALDGWDSHVNITYWHGVNISRLANALKGLVGYLSEWGMLDDSLIIVSTEFGRTLQENAGYGVDHGKASYCLLLGAPQALGRRVIGPEPSLQEAQSSNFLSSQVPVTGLLQRVLERAGFAPDRFDEVFPTPMDGESATPSIFVA